MLTSVRRNGKGRKVYPFCGTTLRKMSTAVKAGEAEFAPPDVSQEAQGLMLPCLQDWWWIRGSQHMSDVKWRQPSRPRWTFREANGPVFLSPPTKWVDERMPSETLSVQHRWQFQVPLQTGWLTTGNAKLVGRPQGASRTVLTKLVNAQLTEGFLMAYQNISQRVSMKDMVRCRN